MITETAHTNCFRVGRKITLAEVRDYQEAGLWTPELRTRLIRSAVLQKKLMERDYPDMPGVVRYYAGRISVLKSQVTMDFSEPEEMQDEEIAHLMFRSLAHAQEHLREVTTYTTASGWDWEKDEEEELDLYAHPMTFSLSPSDLQSAFHFTVRWLCISLVYLLLLPSIPVYMIPCVLLSSASFALSLGSDEEERK